VGIELEARLFEDGDLLLQEHSLREARECLANQTGTVELISGLLKLVFNLKHLFDVLPLLQYVLHQSLIAYPGPVYFVRVERFHFQGFVALSRQGFMCSKLFAFLLQINGFGKAVGVSV